LQLTAEEKRIFFKKFIARLSKKTKPINELEDKNQTKNNKTNKDSSNTNEKPKDQQKGKEKETLQKQDTPNDFDWFLNYPITPEMQKTVN